MGVYITNATTQQVMKVVMNSTEWLPDDVEVFEVPTPHGRLIDADELKKHKYHDKESCENAVAVAEIDWSPVIIEAEE